MNKKKTSIVVGSVLVMAAVTVGIISGLNKRAKIRRSTESKISIQHSAYPVTLERVQAIHSGKPRSFPGIVKASEESALSFRVGGPLIQVDVKRGERVEKGTLLMQIDPRDFEDRIQSLEAQLTGLEAMLRNARSDYERVSALFAEKVVPQADYDRSKSSLASAEAAVKVLNAQLQIARHSLKDSSLLAPYDGTVTEQLAENHEMVNSGDVVLRFHNIQWLEVTVSVPENEIVRRSMNVDTLVQVGFPAIPGKIFEAHLTEWSSVADSMTRTYAVTFSFKAPPNLKVLPGMSAKVSWRDGPVAETKLLVPVSALSSGLEGNTVLWVYDEGSGNAERRSVVVGELEGTSMIAVLNGIAEGEQVVVSGSRFIHDGTAVKSTKIQ